MAVTNGFIYSESWKNVFATIKSNVPHPNFSNSKFIFGSFPDSDNIDKSEYPIIVVHPINSDSTDILSINRNTKIMKLNTEIEIYSTNSEELDTLGNYVTYAIENNESDLYNNRLKNFVLINSDSDTVFRGKIRVHNRRYIWNFEYHWDSSETAISPVPFPTSSYGISIATTAERLALAVTEGRVVYDTDLHELFYYDGSNWVNA